MAEVTTSNITTYGGIATNVYGGGNQAGAETTNVTTSSIPQTGDNIILYISMLGLSVISIIGIEVYTKKFN